MKKCIKCQCDIPNNAMFCPECGTAQETTAPESNTSQASNVPPQSPPPQEHTTQQIFSQAGADTARIAQQLSSHIFTQVSTVLRWEKLAYIGICMVAISVVLPLISISLVSCVTSMVSISQMLSFVLLALCCLSGYYASEEKYNVPLSISIGVLATFSAIYYKLHSVINNASDKIAELTKLGKGVDAETAFVLKLLNEYADKIIGLGMGVYFLLAGTLIVIIACAACRLSRKQEDINIGNIFTESKSALMESAEISGQKLPGFVISIIVVMLLLFIATNIEIFGFKVSAMF